MTPTDERQLRKELSKMDFKQLFDAKHLYLKYFGQYAPETRLIYEEIRRRKSMKPGIKIAIENIKKLSKQCRLEIKRLEALRFDYHHKLYNPITLEEFIPKSWRDPDNVLTGRLAYAVACERIAYLEANMQQFDQHITILQDGNRVTGITMDIIEAYNIDVNQYRNDLYSRLDDLKAKVYPGTSKHMPTLFRHYVPKPEPDSGPRIGDYIETLGTKNFKAGSYKIVMGGAKWNRYYCRKMLERLEPVTGHKLFVIGYAGGAGHYIIAVPDKKCRRRALFSSFIKAEGTVGYFERNRSTFWDHTQP